MWKTVARKAATLVAPEWFRRRDLRRAHVEFARAFRDALSALPTLEAKVERTLADPRYATVQRPTEILNLLARVQELKSARICEIGSYAGGTLALFSQIAPPDARLLSLDIQYLNERDWAFREFARPGQVISTLQADSHRDETLAKVRAWLGGASFDFLFIDGDHSFAGVERDFAMYAPLVRPGGLVAFHDIVMDNRTRHGTSTGGDVGEVPRFWGGLKAKGYAIEEFVENPNQDGMGIGLIHWDGKVR